MSGSLVDNGVSKVRRLKSDLFAVVLHCTMRIVKASTTAVKNFLMHCRMSRDFRESMLYQ
jgi:hypothetical protein